jgi:Flp pilus assembly protein TadG
MKYIVVLARGYLYTVDGEVKHTPRIVKADRYSLESAERLAKLHCGVVMTEHGQFARRGIAALELAMVLPLFVFLLLGALEIGRVLQCQSKITNVSYGIARCIASNASQAEVDDYITKALDKAGIQDANVSVKSALQGQPVTVTLSVPISSVSWLPPKLMTGTLVASSTLRRE